MKKIITILLIVVAVIHLIPVSGVMGSERLSVLYGIPFQESNLSILMRHRAVLFGILGTIILYAAFKPMYQPMAFIAGYASIISFIFLSWSVGDYNESIHKVLTADIVAFISLSVALVCYVIKNRKS